MNEVTKTDGRGSAVKASWDMLKSGGGLAIGSDELNRLLDESVQTRRTLSSEEVSRRIVSYFDSVTATDENGNVTWITAPTKSGLARNLGVSIQTMMEYVQGYDRKGNVFGESSPLRKIRTEDFPKVRVAVQIVEEFYETRLSSGSPVGSIFWLKNAQNSDWSEQQTLTLNRGQDERTPSQSLEAIESRYGKINETYDNDSDL